MLIAFYEIKMFIFVIMNKVKYIFNNCERNAQSIRLIYIYFDSVIIDAKNKIVLSNKKKLVNVLVSYKSIENLCDTLSI